MHTSRPDHVGVVVGEPDLLAQRRLRLVAQRRQGRDAGIRLFGKTRDREQERRTRQAARGPAADPRTRARAPRRDGSCARGCAPPAGRARPAASGRFSAVYSATAWSTIVLMRVDSPCCTPCGTSAPSPAAESTGDPKQRRHGATRPRCVAGSQRGSHRSQASTAWLTWVSSDRSTSTTVVPTAARRSADGLVDAAHSSNSSSHGQRGRSRRVRTSAMPPHATRRRGGHDQPEPRRRDAARDRGGHRELAARQNSARTRSRRGTRGNRPPRPQRPPERRTAGCAAADATAPRCERPRREDGREDRRGSARVRAPR